MSGAAAAGGIGSSAASGVGGIIGGIMDWISQADTNESQREMQWAQMHHQNLLTYQGRLFEEQEARKARDWQERMSNTAWQRSIQDMKAAGVNPMLAFMKGGASTPTGAKGSGVSAGQGGIASLQAPNIREAINKAVSSAVEVARNSEQMKNLESSTELNKKMIQLNQVKKQTERATAKKMEEEAKQTKAYTNVVELSAKKTRKKLEKDLGPARFEADYWASKIGDYIKYWSPFVPSTSQSYGESRRLK